MALDDSLARELALREGVKAFVTGSLARLSGAYTITVQLVAAQSGEALASVRETATDSSEHHHGGGSREQDAAAPDRRVASRPRASADRSTRPRPPPCPALRYYTEGQRLVRQGKRTEAVDEFEQAVRLDTAFASAHLSLAMLYGSMADPGRSERAGQRAYVHRDRLPYLERSFMLASRAYARQDYETAIRIYTDVVGRYPENLAAINNLALAYRDSRRYARGGKPVPAGIRGRFDRRQCAVWDAQLPDPPGQVR